MLLVQPNGMIAKQINEKDEKMGPIYLDICKNDLYQAWNESFHAEVSDFPVDSPDQACINETWVT